VGTTPANDESFNWGLKKEAYLKFGFSWHLEFHFASLREKTIDNFSRRRKDDPKPQSKLRQSQK
jgi:hypothetical protein